MSRNKPAIFVAFGMFLGASVGFADGAMGLHAWSMLGRPDFFIRPNWGEVPHIVLLTFSGTLAGILYGGLLIRISHARAGKLRLGRIYCSSMLLAIPIFFCADYIIVAKRISAPMLTFLPEIAVFLLCVILAHYVSKNMHTPEERGHGPARTE